MAANDPRMILAIEKGAATAPAIEVRWSDGLREVFPGLQAPAGQQNDAAQQQGGRGIEARGVWTHGLQDIEHASAHQSARL